MAQFKNRIVGVDNVDPNSIALNDANYRKHLDAQREMMTGTLEEIGWITAVIVNKSTNHLIDGHMRVELAIEKKEPSVPVIYVDLTEEEELKALATFDPIKMFAKEDRKKLQELLERTEFSSVQTKDLIDRIARKNKLDFSAFGDIEKPTIKKKQEDKKEMEEQKRQELVEKWQVKPGMVWVIESAMLPGRRHRLMCGDSLNPDDIKKLLGDGKYPLIATDPPYGVSFEAKYDPRAKDWGAIKNDDKRGIDQRSFIKELLEKWMPYLADDAAYYIWSAAMEEGFANYYAIQDVGLHIQAQITWAKNVFILGQADYHWKHEVCWYAFKKGKNHRWFGGRDQSTLWEVKKLPNSEYSHPMQKPTELYSTAIKNHTKAGEICVDPFCGSGTQIVAAEQHGRICYGMELDPVWVATALERMSKLNLSISVEE